MFVFYKSLENKQTQIWRGGHVRERLKSTTRFSKGVPAPEGWGMQFWKHRTWRRRTRHHWFFSCCSLSFGTVLLFLTERIPSFRASLIHILSIWWNNSVCFHEMSWEREGKNLYNWEDRKVWNEIMMNTQGWFSERILLPYKARIILF